MSNARCWLALGVLSLVVAAPAMAQSFRVQCPTGTVTHPNTDPANHPLVNNVEPAYTGPTYAGTSSSDYTQGVNGPVNGAIKCQQIGGGDGYATMGDGTQTYLFSFGPLSGLVDIAKGKPGTQFPSVFNTTITPTATLRLQPGDPATSFGVPTVPAGGFDSGALSTALNGFFQDPVTKLPFNGAVGLAKDVPNLVTVFDIFEGCPTGAPAPCATPANTVTVISDSPLGVSIGDQVILSLFMFDTPTIPTEYTNNYLGNPPTWTVSAVNIDNTIFQKNFAFQFVKTSGPGTGGGLPEYQTPALSDITGLGEITGSAAVASLIDGHVDPRQAIDVGIMNGNIPAPLMALDEDDEFFLTLSNVGMIMRPDLFEQHTVHFHGYPNASAFYDGVPDASVAINIGASFTYYYLAPDAGTYFWHCHITPPEHLQMGMVGQLFVRPRQDRVPPSLTLYQGLVAQETDLRTKCVSATDILCSNPLPAAGDNGLLGGFTTDVASSKKFAYNDGDGSTYYDVEYPVQMHGFDPNFHFVGMTFNPEGFSDMKDKYFLLNGRSYPDTVTPGPLETQSSDGVNHFSQPLPTIIDIQAGQRALLRISDLNVSEYHTLASLGVPMQVIGYNAKLLRDQAGNNLYYTTNSITLGGGESLDVILDTCRTHPTLTTSTSVTVTDYTTCATGGAMPAGTYYLYTSNLDHLSNDAENFGGQLAEVRVH